MADGLMTRTSRGTVDHGSDGYLRPATSVVHLPAPTTAAGVDSA